MEVHGQDSSGSKGHMIAAALVGAWRSSPPSLGIPAADLAAIAPLLVESGAGALAWWRIRHSGGHAVTSALGPFRETYLHYAIHAAEHECEVVEAFNTLRSSGVEPILLKGWAIALAYPEGGLRPSGDIDLCVSPDHYARAKAVLSTRQSCLYSADLDHDTITRFSELTFEALYLRSQLVSFDGKEIRILGAEDHLRIVCLHMLKHGARRPLWLCDVAAALEGRPQDFDWDRCLGKNQRHADWILCSLALAGLLLGAETRDTPAHARIEKLPDWLVRNVLKQWSAPYPPNLPLFVDQVGGRWWRPETISAVRQRWPNPIQATVDAGGSFNAMSHLPYQIRDCVFRAAGLCRQFPSLFRN